LSCSWRLLIIIPFVNFIIFWTMEMRKQYRHRAQLLQITRRSESKGLFY
jgi:hypothetical protein